MGETTQLDVTMFIAEALATNPKAYKYLDKIYALDKEEYIGIIEGHKEWNDLKIAKEGCVEHELYFIKSMAILELGKQRHDMESLIEATTKIFKPAYNFVMSRKKLVLTELVRNLSLKHKDVTTDYLNGNLIAAILLAQVFGFEIDTSDFMYMEFVKSLQMRWARYKINNRLDSNNLDKDDKKMVQKIYTDLRSKYLKTLIPYLHNTDLSKREEDDYILSKFNDIDKFLVPLEYVFDNEGIMFDSVVSRITLKEKDVKDIILGYLIVNQIEDPKDVDLKDLYKYVIMAMNMTYMIREYKRTREMLISSINMDVKDLLDTKNNENRELKLKNLRLQDENEKLKIELELLKRKNDSLKKELDIAESSKKELVELRNYIFNNSEIAVDSIEDDIDSIADRLKDINAVVFGGHPQWISKMKELVDWTFVPADAMNFDVSILESADYVFINTTCISHGMYYKVVENVKAGSKLKYINNVNVYRCLLSVEENM